MSFLHKGFASAFATKPASASNALQDIFELRRKPLYENGPYVSPVGFGSYRIGLDANSGYPACEEALQFALKKGLNLIDTSSNYRLGQSEQLIGKVLFQLVEKNFLRREQIVLVSKVGYLQGNTLDVAKTRLQDGIGFPEICEFGDHTWYCLHPDFIFHQIEQSLQNLGVETLDVYLLHNPEYILKRYELDGLSVEQAREKFDECIKKSFSALQELVNQGKIRAFGVSSNQLGVPEKEFCAISLTRLLRLAREANAEQGFQVIQCPLNWLEVFPAFYLSEEGREPLLSFAQKNKIGVLTNRPFNAMLNDGLIRLTRPSISARKSAELQEHLKKGFENWDQLSQDLETLAKEKCSEIVGYEDAPLSQLVLSTLVWLPGVTSVLCGMRKNSYVQDAENALSRPALLKANKYLKEIYQSLEFTSVEKD